MNPNTYGSYERTTLSLDEILRLPHLLGEEPTNAAIQYLETVIRRRMAAAWSSGARAGLAYGTGGQWDPRQFEFQLSHALDNPYA